MLTAVLLWPLHRSGYPIARDMVFTPHPDLTWASIGLGSGAPRAVPVDALVSLGSSLVGGAVLSRVAIALPLIAAGIGVAALVTRGGTRGPSRVAAVAGLAAAGEAIWNPYVVERLAMGDWSLLWAYAALPWIVLLAARVRDGAAPGLLLLAVAAGSITPTGGVVAVLVAGVCTWPGRAPGQRRWGLEVLATLALQLPWIVPGLIGGAGSTSDPSGVAAFAARGEHAGGAVLSLLGTGGVWNTAAVPPSRGGWLAWVGLAAVLGAVVAGWRPAGDILGRVTRTRLTWCAGSSLVVAAASSVPGLDAVLRGLVRAVPGTGLLRDAQKWVMPYAVFVAVLAGCALLRVTARGLTLAAAAVAGAVAPLLLLPDARATLAPVLRPAHYPSDWSWAARTVGSHGAVLVLPFQAYRAFAWTPGRAVLDPAPRLLPGDVVVSDSLVVGSVSVAGEDARAARVAALVRRPASGLAVGLEQEGIGWVLVEHGTPGELPDLTALTRRRSGTELTLYRVSGTVAAHRVRPARAALVVGADVVAVVTVGGALVGSFASAGRRRRTARVATSS